MPDELRPLDPQPDEQGELTPEEFIMAGEVEEEKKEEEPVELIEIEEGSTGERTEIKAFGRGARAAARDLRHEEALQRPLNVTGQGATRTRTFHSKLNDAALAIMDQLINEWIDKNGIEIKCASSCVGIFEGKKSEPHLLVTVCY